MKTLFAALLLSLLGVGSVHAQCSEIDATSFTFEVLESTSTITRISWTFEDFNDSFDNRIALEFGELNSGDRYRFESEGTDGTGEFSTSTLPAGNYSLNIRAYCSSNDSSELFDAGIGNIEVTESTPASCSFSVSDFTVNATDGTDDMPYDDMVDLNYSGGETLDSIHFIITETTTGWTDSTTVTYDVDESRWPVQFSYLTAGEYTISLRPYCSGQASALITNGNSWQFTISCTSEQASPVIDEVEYTPVCTGTTTVTLTTSSSCGSADNFEYYLDDPDWDGDPNNYDGTYTDVTPGRHTFTVVNVNNSHQTDTTFSVETTVQFTVANNNARVCENASDTLRAIVSAGTAPYTYQWYYDGDYPDLGDGSNLLPIPNGPSNYVTCIVTDANSCQAQIDLEWTVLPAYTQETDDQYDNYEYSTNSFHVPQNLCPLTRFGVTYDCGSDSTMDVHYQTADGCDSIQGVIFTTQNAIAIPVGGILDTTISSGNYLTLTDDGGGDGFYTLNSHGKAIIRAAGGDRDKLIVYVFNGGALSNEDTLRIYKEESETAIGYSREGTWNLPGSDTEFMIGSGVMTVNFYTGSLRGEDADGNWKGYGMEQVSISVKSPDQLAVTPICGGTGSVQVTNPTSGIYYCLTNPGGTTDTVYCGSSSEEVIFSSLTESGSYTLQSYIKIDGSYETTDHDTTFTIPASSFELSVSGDSATVCKNNLTHTLTAVVSGGTEPFSYSWTTTGEVGTDATYTLATADETPTITVTDNEGCTASYVPNITWANYFDEENEVAMQALDYDYTFHRARNAVGMQMPLTIGGQEFTGDETHSVNFHTVDGCDSIVSIELTVGTGLAFPSVNGATLDTTITDETTILYDDGVNSSWYELNCSRTVTLRAPEGNTLTVELTSDNLSEEDHIAVDDGSGQYYPYTHAGNNMVITSQSGYLTLTFVSGSIRGQGFEITVTKEAASCLPPYGMNLSLVTNGATLSWNHTGTAQEYLVTLRQRDYDEQTYSYTTVDSNVYSTTDTFYTFSNLTGGKYYDYLVKVVCSESDTVSGNNGYETGFNAIAPYLIPASGDTTITLNENAREVYVYDDGGADGNYSNSANGSLTLKAAEGYVIRLEEVEYTTENNSDQLTITDDYLGSATNINFNESYTGTGTSTDYAEDWWTKGFKFSFESDNSVAYSGVVIRVTQAKQTQCLPSYNPKAERVQSYYEIYDLLAYGESSGSVEMKKSNHATGNVEYDTITVNNGYLIYTPDYSMDVQVRPICNDYAEAEWSDMMLLSACTPPSTLSVEIAQMTALQQAYATLTWEDVGAESYLVYYHKTGDNNWDTKVATASPYELEGLAPMTEYQAYVRSICSEGDTSYMASTTKTFSTGCGFRPGLADGEILYEVPTAFNFENVEEGEMPYCWTNIAYQDIYPGMTQFTDDNDEVHALQFKTNAASDHYAVMPMFDTIYGSMDKWVIHFTPELMNLENLASEVCTEDTATIIVGVMTDPADASTFTAVQSVSVRKAASTEVLVPLRDYSGSGLYPAFKMPAGSGHAQTDLVVSNVFVIPDGHLEAPTNITVAPHPTQSGKIVVSWDCDDSQLGYDDDGHANYIVSINGSTEETYDKSLVVSATAGDVLRIGVAHAFTGARYQAYGSWFNASSEIVDYIVPLYDNQRADTIGDLSNLTMTSYEMPWATGEDYGSQMLILNSELKNIKSVSSIAFRIAPGCDQSGFQNATVYLANTDISEFTATGTGSYTLGSYVEYTTMTEAGYASFTASEGWHNVTLTLPTSFLREEGKNLAIAIASNSGDQVNTGMTRFYLDPDSYGKGLKLPGVTTDNIASMPTSYDENPVTYRPQILLFEDRSCTNDTIVDSVDVCENASYDWRGKTISFNDDDIELHKFVDSTYSYVTFSYEYTYRFVYYDTVAGVGTDDCDSIYKLVITKRYNESWDGNLYSGYYNQYEFEDYSQITSCGPYTWIDGNTYTQSTGYYYDPDGRSGCGAYLRYADELHYDTVPGVATYGCDSLYVLNLVVDPWYTIKFDSTNVNPGTGMADQYVCQDSPDFVVPACTMVRDYYAFDGWLLDGDTIQPDSTLTLTDSISLTPLWRVDCETQVAMDEPNEFCGNSDFTYSWHGHSVNLDYLKANAEYEYLGDEVSAFTLHDTVAGAVGGGLCDSVYTLSVRSDIASFNVTSASVCPIGYTWIDDSTYTQNVGADQYGNIDPSSMRYIIDSTNASCYTINALSVYIDTEWTNYDTITYYYIQDGAVYRTKPVCNDAYYNLIACDTTREGYDFMGWQLVGAPSMDTLPAGYQADAQGDAAYYAIWKSNCTDKEVYDTTLICSNDTIVWHGETWRGGGLAVGEWDTVITHSGVIPGECDSIYHLHVTVPSVPMLSMTNQQSPLCYGSTNGAITVAVSNGNAPFQYALGDSNYTAALDTTAYKFENLTAGAHIVWVKDACGITDNIEVTITEPDVLTVNVTSYTDNAVCYEAGKQLNAEVSGGTSPYTYMWNRDNTRSHDTLMVNTTVVGDRLDSVIVTDANGCITTASYTTHVYDSLTVTLNGGDTTYCYGATAVPITVTVTGGDTNSGYTYTWYDYNQQTVQGESITVPTNVAATYSQMGVTVSNTCGTKQLTVPAITVLDSFYVGPVSEVNASYCFNATASQIEVPVTGGGAFSGQWYMNGTAVTDHNPGDADNKYTPRTDTAGTFNYSLKIVSDAGCGSDSVTVGTVKVYDPFSVTAHGSDTSYCINAQADTLSITVTGANEEGNSLFSWYAINGTDTTSVNNDSPGNTTYVPPTTTAGTTRYIVIVDAGCGVDTANVATITVNATSTGDTTVVACDSYTWIDSVTYTSTPVSNMPTYVLTNAVGCDSTVTLNLTINRSLAASITPDTLYNCMGNEGSFTVTVTDGTEPTYQWYRNGEALAGETAADLNFNTDSAGTFAYSVVVTDGAGCGRDSLYAGRSIVYSPMTVTSLSTDTSYYCFGSSIADLTADFSGGSGRYFYNWYLDNEMMDGENGTSLTPSSTPGEYAYSLQIGDSAGCDGAIQYFAPIKIYDEFTVAIDTNEMAGEYNTCYGSTNGFEPRPMAVIVSGGSGDYTYQWYRMQADYDPNDGVRPGSGPGTLIDGADSSSYNSSTTDVGNYSYSVVVTDNKSCGRDSLYAASFHVMGTPVIISTSSDTTICYGSTLTLSVAADTAGDGRGGMYIYKWYANNVLVDSIGETADTVSTYQVTGTTTGTTTYKVVVYSFCENADSTEVTVANVTVREASNGDTTVTACDSYTWIDSVTYTETPTTAMPTYVLQNQYGCDSTVTLNLTINRSLAASITPDTLYNCMGNEGSFTVTVTDGTEPTYQWYRNGEALADETAADLNFNTDSAGTFVFSVVVTDGAGCGRDSLYAGRSIVYSPITVTIANQDTAYCLGVEADTLRVTNITGGSGNYSYRWYMNGQESMVSEAENYKPSTTEAGAATYSVRVMDNECGDDTTLSVATITINAPSTGDTTVVACDSYTWINDSTYTTNTSEMPEAQTHTITGADINGCDSTVTLNLTINSSSRNTLTETACDNYTWNLTGETYTTSTDTSVVLTNAAGCDSTVTLQLTMYNSSETHDTITACESYEWHNNTYDSTGVYSIAQETANGCDSTMYLNLTINHSTTGIDSVTTCDSVTWIDGNTYSATMVAESPTYTYQNGAANGCDSVVTLHLTLAETYTAYFHCQECDTNFMPNIEVCSLTPQVVMPENEYEYEGHIFIGWIGSPDTVQPGDTVTISSGIEFWAAWRTECSNIDTVEYATICEGDSITWRGMTIDGLAQEYSDTVAGVVDVLCDSVYHLLLTVNYPTTSDTTMMACDSVWWNGMFFTETPDTTQSYFIAGGNQYGCDSTAYLNLTVNYSIHDYVVETACDSYTFDSVTYTESTDLPTIGDISDNGCPFITHISLTVNYSYHGEDSATACDMYVWNDMELTEGGDHDYVGYTTDGCDSVVTLHLTLHQTAYGMDTQTACDSLEWIDGNLYFSDFPGEVGEISYLFPGGSMYGCDSVAVLDLTMEDHIYVEFISDFGEGTMNEMSSCRQKPFVVPQCAYTNEGFVFKGWVNQVVHDTVQPGDTVFLEETTSFIASWTPLCEDVLVFTDTALCEGSTFVWRGYDYTNELYSGDYEDVAYAVIENYCDSIYYLRLTVYPISYNEFFDSVVGSLIWYDEEYTTTGDYSRFCGYNRYGCDSTEVLHLVVNLSIDDKDGVIEVKVYPNPTTGPVNLDGVEIKRISVVDMVGRTAATFDGQSQIDISDLPAGQYTLLIETPQGNTTRRIIKR